MRYIEVWFSGTTYAKCKCGRKSSAHAALDLFIAIDFYSFPIHDFINNKVTMKKILLALAIPTLILFTGCASMFGTRNQRVSIEKEDSYEFLVDGEEPNYIAKADKYKFPKERGGMQLEFKKEGYKSEYDVRGFEKQSPWRILTGIVSIPTFGYILAFDQGKKAFRYNPLWDYRDLNLQKWPSKTQANKEIVLDNFAVNVGGENFSFRNFSNLVKYRKNESESQVTAFDEAKDLVVENTNFERLLNGVLAEQGYIDTTKKVLKNSFANNLMIDAEVNKINFDLIGTDKTSLVGNSLSANRSYKIDMTMVWEVKNYYGEVLETLETDVKSGIFAESYYGEEAVEMAIVDALEEGLMAFLTDEGVQERLNDRSQVAAEASFEEIEIPEASQYVNDLASSIKSSVTIVRKDDGHGSGFIVTEGGYIITNYHVVSGSQDDLEVVLNNGNRHKGTVIRSSKTADVALIAIDVNGLVPFKLSSQEAGIAEDIYAVGTPTAQDLGQSISRGIVSGIRSGDGDVKLIQTDASINGGNSGGALVNKQGLVLGVVQAKVKGFGVEGIAFGIPTEVVIEKLRLKL